MEKHSTMVDLGAQCLIAAAVAGFCVARVIRK